ncbi:MAG: CheR family methyltransferase [Spirochaetota bacterium]
MSNPFNKPLSQHDFDFIRNIVFKESGIKLSDMKKALVQSRLLRRMRELHIQSYDEYCDYVRKNYEEEIGNLINCITTNKTEFFREKDHFSILQDVLEREFCHKNIALWSAGCSTGEEAYSIAIAIMESGFKKQFTITATDIDTNVLSVAQNGIYPMDAVHMFDSNLLKKYFLKGKDQYQGYVKVKPILKDKIVFQHLNLLDDNYRSKKLYDIIFCRNVMIYFDKDVQAQVLKKFYDYLPKGGYLFLGYAESIVSSNVPFYYIAHSVYQKR